MGRDRSRPLRKDWDAVKEQVAEDAIRAKFKQNEEARKLLLQTGTKMNANSMIEFNLTTTIKGMPPLYKRRGTITIGETAMGRDKT